MILECIPYRKTKIGKEKMRFFEHLQRVNPVGGELLKKRIGDINAIILREINETRTTVICKHS